MPDINELASYMRIKRESAERKRNMLLMAAQKFGRKVDSIELDRAGHEDDKIADAYEMLIDTIMKRKLENSAVRNEASNLKLITIDSSTREVVEVQPAPKANIPVPKIENPKVAQQAQDIIDADEVEESVDEAARNGNWDVARSKVMHFFRGSDEVPMNASDAELDEFIREIMKRQLEKRTRKYEEEIGLTRKVSPLKTPDQIAKVQYLQGGKFNVGIFIGDSKESTTEDRTKLAAIQAYTAGNEKTAVQIIHLFYKEKGWSEVTAREFLLTLMKKDPHKELNTVIRNILEYNKDKKGDPKQGVKFCRSIVGAYFDKKYTTANGGKLTVEQDRDNKLIDRIINRQLKEVIGE